MLFSLQSSLSSFACSSSEDADDGDDETNNHFCPRSEGRASCVEIRLRQVREKRSEQQRKRSHQW